MPVTPERTLVCCVICGATVELEKGPAPLCHSAPMGKKRKPYTKPELRFLGTVGDLTHGHAGSVADGSGALQKGV